MEGGAWRSPSKGSAVLAPGSDVGQHGVTLSARTRGTAGVLTPIFLGVALVYVLLGVVNHRRGLPAWASARRGRGIRVGPGRR
jgi:hypothetical protein